MNMSQRFYRYFKNNNEYKDFKDLLFIDSLAYTVQEFLYSNKAIDEKTDFSLDERIRLYDFMSLVVVFISNSFTDLAKCNIKEYVHSIKTQKKSYLYKESVEYFNENSLLVTSASHELIFDILWAAWIYTLTRYIFEEDEKMKNSSKLFYQLMKEYCVYNNTLFLKLPLIKQKDAAVYIMCMHINKHNDKITSTINIESPINKISSSQKQQIEDLENEITRLNNILNDANTIPANITAKQKVRMELARILMEKAGITTELLKRHGNKDKAGTIMGALLDIPAKTCKQYYSDPKLNKGYHKETVMELNAILNELKIDIQL